MNNVNVPLLRKAVEWVEAEASKPKPEREWFQPAWVKVWGTFNDASQATYCGTTYCLAGYVAQLVNPAYTDDPWGGQWACNVSESLHASEVARTALGLTTEQAHDLFYAANTAQEIRSLAEGIVGGSL